MQKCAVIIFSLLFSLTSSASFAQMNDATSISLEFMWKIDGFDRPESLIPSADGSEIYASNINGKSGVEDGNGYISRVSLDGKVIEKKWITGLDGPLGFALDKGKIYATDVNDLVVIDVSSGEVIKRVPVPETGFLNDVTVVNGRVFFSDTGADTLYSYTDDDGLSVFKSGEEVNALNGLLPDGDKLLLTMMQTGELMSVDLSDGSMTTIGSGIINGDGIGILPGGGYLITSFSGEIYHIKSATETIQLLDTKPEKISQNDSYYLNGVLYVANINPGSVTAWKVVKATD